MDIGDGNRDPGIHNVASPEVTDVEMETTFTTFKPDNGFSVANPLYESTVDFSGRWPSSVYL